MFLVFCFESNFVLGGRGAGGWYISATPETNINVCSSGWNEIYVNWNQRTPTIICRTKNQKKYLPDLYSFLANLRAASHHYGNPIAFSLTFVAVYLKPIMQFKVVVQQRHLGPLFVSIKKTKGQGSTIGQWISAIPLCLPLFGQFGSLWCFLCATLDYMPNFGHF